MTTTSESPRESLLVVSAHAGDFIWRAGGAIALSASRGDRATVVCLSFGERGESARAWREGKTLEEIKAVRRAEAESAAGILGAEVRFLDVGDYPLLESHETVDQLVRVYREVEPTVVLTHTLVDPYNGDHPAAARMAIQARILARSTSARPSRRSRRIRTWTGSPAPRSPGWPSTRAASARRRPAASWRCWTPTTSRSPGGMRW